MADVASKQCDSCGRIEHPPKTEMWYAVAYADGVVLTGYHAKLREFLDGSFARDTQLLDVCSLECGHRLIQTNLHREEVRPYESPLSKSSVVVPMSQAKPPKGEARG